MPYYKLDQYTIEYPENIKTIIEEDEFTSISFYVDGFVYQILKCTIGLRLIINSDPSGDGFFRDLPFHFGTAPFLPKCISIK